MDDFEERLRSKLDRNVEVEEERERARQEFQEYETQRKAEEEQRERRVEQVRHDSHEELAGQLQELLGAVQRSSDNVVVRAGWSDSGEEFVAELSTVQLEPSRTLFVELDRDDDEVLARWTSDEGDAVEIWRLHEFDADMLQELVLQLIDQELWRPGSGTPAFPGH